MSQVALAEEQSSVQRVSAPIGVAPATESAMMIQMIQRAAADPTVDVDKMERLMQMHERFVDRQASAAFNAAMVRAQQCIRPVVRRSLNTQTNSSYAKLEDIDQAISPVYTEQGFSLSFGTIDSPLAGHIRVICDVMHDQGHTKQYQMDLPLDATGIGGKTNKTGVHAHGSTNSYARRYLTMNIFNVVMVNEDNDGNREPIDPPAEPMITAGQAAQLDALLKKCSQTLQDNFAAKYGVAANVYKSEFDAVSARITKAATQPKE
ncbi:ERF family protein [Pseudomonas gregormendelii]